MHKFVAEDTQNHCYDTPFIQFFKIGFHPRIWDIRCTSLWWIIITGCDLQFFEVASLFPLLLLLDHVIIVPGSGVAFSSASSYPVSGHYYGWLPDLFLFFSFFWSGLQCPKAYSLWGGVVPSPSIG